MTKLTDVEMCAQFEKLLAEIGKRPASESVGFALSAAFNVLFSGWALEFVRDDTGREKFTGWLAEPASRPLANVEHKRLGFLIEECRKIDGWGDGGAMRSLTEEKAMKIDDKLEKDPVEKLCAAILEGRGYDHSDDDLAYKARDFHRAMLAKSREPVLLRSVVTDGMDTVQALIATVREVGGGDDGWSAPMCDRAKKHYSELFRLAKSCVGLANGSSGGLKNAPEFRQLKTLLGMDPPRCEMCGQDVGVSSEGLCASCSAKVTAYLAKHPGAVLR